MLFRSCAANHLVKCGDLLQPLPPFHGECQVVELDYISIDPLKRDSQENRILRSMKRTKHVGTTSFNFDRCNIPANASGFCRNIDPRVPSLTRGQFPMTA
mgnify:FL=1